MRNSPQFKVHETNKTYGRNLTIRMIDVSRAVLSGLVDCRCLEMARFYVRRCRVRRLLRTYTSDGAFENTHHVASIELSRIIVWHHLCMSPQGYECVNPYREWCRRGGYDILCVDIYKRTTSETLADFIENMGAFLTTHLKLSFALSAFILRPRRRRLS